MLNDPGRRNCLRETQAQRNSNHNDLNQRAAELKKWIGMLVMLFRFPHSKKKKSR